MQKIQTNISVLKFNENYSILYFSHYFETYGCRVTNFNYDLLYTVSCFLFNFNERQLPIVYIE